jgi:Sulfotransferase family
VTDTTKVVVPVTDPIDVRVRAWGRWTEQRIKTLSRKWSARLRETQRAPNRPVLVVGSPRSGTSVVFDLLQRHKSLASLGEEGHLLWKAYQHPRRKGWSSDRAIAADIHPDERRFIYSTVWDVAGRRRFLDKTPSNALKLPYLAELFPDAAFVIVKRNAPETVGSLIEAWRARFGVAYRLPVDLALSDYSGRYWCFALFPAWRDLVKTSLADIAAQQFAASYDQLLEDTASCLSSRHTVTEIRYEDLLQAPVDVSAQLLEQLELEPSDAVFTRARTLTGHLSKSTVSPPRADKWRDYEEQVRSVLPQLRKTILRLGYSADGASAPDDIEQ